jgi:O-acetyl-ADP-ribose deacetylase (regulator of RNase III)
MSYKEIEGNLITLALEGNFDVITHGCNCFCTMSAGIAVPMKKNFKCDQFPLELSYTKGDINKLGQIDYHLLFKEKDEYGGKWVKYVDKVEFMTDKKLIVVNSYTQYHYGKNHPDGKQNPIDYEALTLCMRKINNRFSNKRIGLPKIGAGLAGGDWNIIKKIIQNELKDCDVTIVYLPK